LAVARIDEVACRAGLGGTVYQLHIQALIPVM
jgi:hypothetical protein